MQNAGGQRKLEKYNNNNNCRWFDEDCSNAVQINYSKIISRKCGSKFQRQEKRFFWGKARRVRRRFHWLRLMTRFPRTRRLGWHELYDSNINESKSLTSSVHLQLTFFFFNNRSWLCLGRLCKTIMIRLVGSFYFHFHFFCSTVNCFEAWFCKIVFIDRI